ncbi:hypothetical protein [Streptomyces boninensis]|uniref:hypothetical protein n=1 Tax=Streptomyces boninensis TaxID=2039455 RepID=UPI003B21B848
MGRRSLLADAAAGAAGVFIGTSAGASTARVAATPLRSADGSFELTSISDVSRNGRVLGFSGSGADGYRRGVWGKGRLVELAAPEGGSVSTAESVNSLGQVAGSGYLDGVRRPVLWSGGKPQVLGQDATPAYAAYAAYVNDRGQVLVNVLKEEPVADEVTPWRLHLHQHGEVTPVDLPAHEQYAHSPHGLSHRGHVVADVGFMGWPGDHYVWRAGEAVRLRRDYFPLTPEAVNSAGQVAVSAMEMDPDGDMWVYIWQDGQDRDFPGSGWSTFRGSRQVLNARGDVVGAHRVDEKWQPFLWTGDQVSTLLTLGGDAETTAVAINNRREIAGTSPDPGGTPPTRCCGGTAG